MTAADRARTLFSQVYGAEPAGCWAAPGRVNLIGEHTDYNGGFVLPFALPQLCVVAASPVDGPEWTVVSESQPGRVGFGREQLRPGQSTPGQVEGWAAYVAGVLWSLRAAGYQPGGARLAIASDVPVGSGLSSSAALECAVLTAVSELSTLDVPVADRPRLAQRAENDYVGVPCGILDQSAATLCRAGHALFLDCRSLGTEQVPFDLADAGLAVLVIDTRAPHRLVDGEYAARRTSCEAAARALGLSLLREVTDLDAALARLDDPVLRRRVRHVVTEDQRVLDVVALLREGKVPAIGPLLTASHSSLRADYEVSAPELDVAVEAALRAGAYGARMTGGGFGGCAIALVDADRADQVGTEVTRAFAAAGFGEPATFPAVPSDGARRLS